MKKHSKRGFTITELAIVIAVIAILSAVLIPTFAGITNKAKASAAEQAATNAMKVVLVEEDMELDAAAIYYFISGEYWFKADGNNVKKVDIPAASARIVGEGDTVYYEDAEAYAAVKADTEAGLTVPTDSTVFTLDTLADLGEVVVWIDAE